VQCLWGQCGKISCLIVHRDVFVLVPKITELSHNCAIVICYQSTADNSLLLCLVSRPNFSHLPCSLVENRVWTLSLGNWNQLTYCSWNCMCLVTSNFVCIGAQNWLLVVMCKCNLFLWAIWLVQQHADLLHNFAPRFPSEGVKESKPHFQ